MTKHSLYIITAISLSCFFGGYYIGGKTFQMSTKQLMADQLHVLNLIKEQLDSKEDKKYKNMEVILSAGISSKVSMSAVLRSNFILPPPKVRDELLEMEAYFNSREKTHAEK